MYRSLIVLMALFCFGCGETTNPVDPGDVTATGKIVVSVQWPQGVAGKTINVYRDAPKRITLYIYRLGKEITRADLTHTGTHGTAEITVAAQSGYAVELVAFDEYFDMALYTGEKYNISVSANTSTSVDIIMYDAAPVLYPARITGDSSYVLTWSKVPLATSYMVEESTSNILYSDDSIKLSSTIYSGSDSTYVITKKNPGTYFYVVFAMTKHGDSYSPTPAGEGNFDFYLFQKYGAISNMISVTCGATGSMKIDIPWPTK